MNYSNSSSDSKKKQLYQSVCYILVAYFSLSVMATFVKLSVVSLPSSEVLFARFFIGLFFILPLIPTDKKFSWKIVGLRFSVLRNLAGLIGMLLMFYSLKYIPVSTAVLFMNSSSLFIPFFVFLFFKEKTSWRVLCCTFTGFLGVYITLAPSHINVPNLYLSIALASAVFAALAYIGVKKLSQENSPLQIVFYFHLTCSLIIPIASAYDWVLPSLTQFLFLIMVGLFGFLFQLFITKAFKDGAITSVAPFMFSGVLFASLFDWLLWGNIPKISFWLGALVIITSVGFLAKIKN